MEVDVEVEAGMEVEPPACAAFLLVIPKHN